MEQKRLINQFIDESLKELERIVFEQRAIMNLPGGFRHRYYWIRNAHARRSMLVDRLLRDLIFKLDAKIRFAIHRKLRQRHASGLLNFNSERPLPRNARIWRQILVDYIRDSGVSIRTRYFGHNQKWDSDTALIRVTPYQTEKQLFGSLLCAFSHQVLHFRTGRAKSRSIRDIRLFQDEAIAFSYVVARSLGLESKLHRFAIHSCTFNRQGLTDQSKQHIQEAASEVLTELVVRYRHRSGIR